MQFDAQAIYGPAGLLAQHLPGYEFRQEQVDMAEHIYGALVNKGHALVEAGTGVGKSLAYLVPLIYYTVNVGKRAIVATHTITLQEQLFTKDLPFLAEALPLEFTAEVFKGRRNYLCLRALRADPKGSPQPNGPSWRLLLTGLKLPPREIGVKHPMSRSPWNMICCEKKPARGALPHLGSAFTGASGTS